MELLLFCAALGVAVFLLARRGAGRSRAVAAGCALLALVLGAVWSPDVDEQLAAAVPARTTEGGFTTSDACRACHPREYDSWHRSFHRTMTQRATPSSTLAAVDGVRLEDRGHAWRLERRGDEIWAEVPDPLWFEDAAPDKPAAPPRIAVRVVMTTGSHHLQTYWARRPTTGDVHRASHDNGALVQIPWVWLIEDARWAPAQDSFLTPPSSEPEPPLVWNASCFACHSVATRPGFSEGRFESRSVELGIACEACHGPADEHVRANRSPLHRYRGHLFGGGDGDPTTVNPARLEKARSVEVCGQCHSFGQPLEMERYQASGVAFRAGDDLRATTAVFRYAEDPRHPLLRELLEKDPNALEGRFWADGTIRVAGREYNGLLETACFQRGELTCLSCHSMHGYEDRSDQLTPDRIGDEACFQCHGGFRERVGEHTHHARESAGSRCMNCHMPHTTYGLFVAMRSHRIDSPSVAVSVETGRPNACNLCHLDTTLEWTNRQLHEWYGTPLLEIAGEPRSRAASVLWAIQGDAAQRAIAAWHMGWPPAQQASGRKWLGAYLTVLLGDPYRVVRRVAARSIATLPEFGDFEFDYLADAETIARKQHEARARWQQAMAGKPDRSGAQILQDASGRIDSRELFRMLTLRDHRPLRIIE